MSNNINLDEYFQEWQLRGKQLIAATHSADVYHVVCSDGTPAVLKIFNEIGKEDESDSYSLLEWYDGNGAVKLINHGENAHLLEYADGDNLTNTAINGQDKQATGIICDVVGKLHEPRNTATTPHTLIPLESWFQELFTEAANRNNEIITAAADIAKELCTTTQHPIPLHGDLHHDNIINSKRGWLAIDPKGLIGDPCYDLANFYGNPIGMEKDWIKPERINMLTDTFSVQLGYPKDRLLKFAFVHNTISVLWDGCSIIDREARRKLAAYLYNLI